jgi:DNA-binding response OmpR family regulator
VARCRSVLRRRRATPQASLIRIGDLVLDPERFEVRRHDELLELTTKEFSLLLALGRRPGTVVRREELVEEVWGVGAWAANRSLDVHMSALRRKLGDSPHRPRYIRTVHGLGFRLVADAPGQATGRAPRDAA